MEEISGYVRRGVCVHLTVAAAQAHERADEVVQGDVVVVVGIKRRAVLTVLASSTVRTCRCALSEARARAGARCE